MKIKPVGFKLLIEPIASEHHELESGIIAVENQTVEGKVLEVSDELLNIYKEGDVVIYGKKAGVGLVYNNKACLWLDGRDKNNQGDIWGILKEK